MINQSDVKDSTTQKKNKPLAIKVINKDFYLFVDSLSHKSNLWYTPQFFNMPN
jgi:hypothetical protein